MNKSGHIQDPATISQGKNHGIHVTWGWWAPQWVSNFWRREKPPVPIGIRTPDCTVRCRGATVSILVRDWKWFREIEGEVSENWRNNTTDNKPLKRTKGKKLDRPSKSAVSCHCQPGRMAAMRADPNDQHLLILTGALAGYNISHKKSTWLRPATQIRLYSTVQSCQHYQHWQLHTSRQQTFEYLATYRQYPESLHGQLHPALVYISTDHAVAPWLVTAVII